MMGDLKDVSQAGEEKANEKTESVESVEIEAEEPTDQQIEQNIAEKMASLLTNPMFTLPKPVQRSVKALKNLQLQHVNFEVEFFKELHDLEIKYEKKFEPLYEKRSLIVSGAHFPTDEECDFQSDAERDVELSNEVQNVKIDDESGDKTEENKEEEKEKEEKEVDIKGIPEFWLTAFKNAPAIADMIEEYDEAILKHLTNVRAETFSDPMSFTLFFYFEPNEFFSNTVLSKHYELRCTPDESDVFSFEGPEIIKCKGCTIEWKKGKNVTVKTIKKKQKHKARGAVRTVTKTVSNDSFFNFFSPPENSNDDEEELDEETQSILNNDFEVGNLIKDRVIPHAVLFFTGENLVEDDYDDEEDEDEEDFEDEDEEEEEDDDENQQCLNRKKSRGQTGNSQPQAPPECKQQ